MTLTKIDGKKLRQVAGAFPTGVTIITTEKADGTIHGMTASSFLSVSLAPALVSFCVKENAAIFPLLSIGKTVGISILAANQKHISNQFAGFNKEEIAIPMTKIDAGATVVDKALAWYSTKIRQIIPAGDHFLILCEVMDLERAADGNPLVYWSGYRTTSENL
ncbi:MAG: flavin reductase family protein [Saprospiraceae bacterium]